MDGIEKALFGYVGSQPVELYTLRNRGGRVLKVTTYGATVTELHVPDRDGQLQDIVLGFDSLDRYAVHRAYFGAIVGRVANRIRNATFALKGQKYQLVANDGPHHLHGGRRGFNSVVWSATARQTERGPSVELAYVSPDGEEHYPGRVEAWTRYTLTDDDALVVEMWARCERATIINLAHHGYWNLGGHASGHVLDHELQLFAEQFTPGDPIVPAGYVTTVAGTAFDFRSPKPIGRDLERTRTAPAGFDHNWVVDGSPGRLRRVAWVREPRSGREMLLDADAPGVQFYSGNFLDGSLIGKGGHRYGRHAGFCLETQAFPNAINVPAWASQVVCEPGAEYRHQMVHRFSAS